MELKVWVEGIQRIVCGVTETTTCQDVVFALAHATGKVGRFTLIERWRNNERLLAPQEYPLKILMKWGEYSNDIQFILRRSDPGNGQKPPPPTNNSKSPLGNGSQNTSHPMLDNLGSPRMNTTPPFNNNVNTSPGNPVGVVKGVQQAKTPESNSPVMKDVPPYREPPPPYRSPPPPSQAALRKSPNRSRGNRPSHMSPVNVPDENESRSPEAVSYNSQYRELVSLVNYQREKLSSQSVDLIKYDAEIGFWENKGREQDRQVEALQQQASAADGQLRVSTEQVQALNYIEEESELAKQHEKTIKSEIVLVRSKLAHCETELLQCKNKIRKLMEDIHTEQRGGGRQETRHALERSMLAEMENLQSQIQQAKHATEINHLTAENLKREVGVLESAIMEKKRQVERLVQEMKEANLQSLTGSADELRHPLDGLCKAGSARRIIGSPRQLENAAPTNKNPHGVWV